MYEKTERGSCEVAFLDPSLLESNTTCNPPLTRLFNLETVCHRRDHHTDRTVQTNRAREPWKSDGRVT
jgi:hypothetical protein